MTAGTHTGTITGTHLTTTQARLATQTGGIRATFGRTPSVVDATTQTGSVDIAVPRGTLYAVQAGTQTGKVDVSVDRADDSPRVITVKAETGDVTIEAA